MTDRGEGELRKWALKHNGDPPTNKDIVALVLAFADDADAKHEETLTMFNAHLVDAKRMDNDISDLQRWRQVTETTCVERVKKLISEEHADRHGRHLVEHHALQDERADWLIRTLGMRGVSLLFFLIGGLAMAAISYLVWGIP